MFEPFNFSERDKQIINSAEPLGTFEVDLTGDRLSVTISKEARDLLKFLKDEYGIEYEDPRIEWCG